MYHHQWLYHETKAPNGRVVKSEQEEAALGEGWVDTPAKFGAVPAPAPEPILDAPQAMALAPDAEPAPAPEPIKPHLRRHR